MTGAALAALLLAHLIGAAVLCHGIFTTAAGTPIAALPDADGDDPAAFCGKPIPPSAPAPYERAPSPPPCPYCITQHAVIAHAAPAVPVPQVAVLLRMESPLAPVAATVERRYPIRAPPAV